MAMGISRPTEIDVVSGIVNRQTRPLFESLSDMMNVRTSPGQASANHLSMKVRLPDRPNPPFKVDDHRLYNCYCDLRTPRLFSEANR